MPSSFDPAVLASFADRLLLRARSVFAIYSFLGFLAGSGFGVAANAVQGNAAAFAAGALVMLLFMYAGSEKAFRLRVEAHTVLCQVAIEANTRYAANIAARAAGISAEARPM